MSAPDLYGLVLCGGKSTRMGQDKGSLVFHPGKTQVDYCVQLLKPLCTRVFLSCREEQAQLEAYKPYPQLHDNYPDTGPMGGILSAMTALPRVSWLVLAVDMPFVTEETLKGLIKHRAPDKEATVYRNQSDLPEPLCAIYEAEAYGALLDALKKQHYSLLDVMKTMAIVWITPDREDWFLNLNTTDELETLRERVAQI